MGLEDTWGASSLRRLRIRLVYILWTVTYRFPCEHVLSFLLGRRPSVDLLRPRTDECQPWRKHPRVVVTFVSKIQELPLPYILTEGWYYCFF